MLHPLGGSLRASSIRTSRTFGAPSGGPTFSECSQSRSEPSRVLFATPRNGERRMGRTVRSTGSPLMVSVVTFPTLSPTRLQRFRPLLCAQEDVARRGSGLEPRHPGGFPGGLMEISIRDAVSSNARRFTMDPPGCARHPSGGARTTSHGCAHTHPDDGHARWTAPLTTLCLARRPTSGRLTCSCAGGRLSAHRGRRAAWKPCRSMSAPKISPATRSPRASPRPAVAVSAPHRGAVVAGGAGAPHIDVHAGWHIHVQAGWRRSLTVARLEAPAPLRVRAADDRRHSTSTL